MRRHRRFTFCFLWAALFIALNSVVGAADPQGPIFAVIEENDLLSNPFSEDHQDRHYTHGMKFVYLGGDDRLAPRVEWFAHHLPAWWITPAAYNAGLVLGQQMYTPEDLHSTTVVTGDRPYAGWLYAGVILQRHGETPSAAIPVMDSLELDLGIIGPASLAAEAQRTVHRYRFPDDIPKGWGNQLKNEPGFVLKGARLWRLAPSGDMARHLDFIPYVGASGGNVQTFGDLGATFRVGWNLPADFGVPNIDSTATIHGGFVPSDPMWGFHLFGRVEGRAIYRNIFLDGNTWEDSHRVSKNPFVADLTWGVVFQLSRHFDVSYIRIVRTEEFEHQRGYDIFGSLIVKGKFDF